MTFPNLVSSFSFQSFNHVTATVTASGEGDVVVAVSDCSAIFEF
jgi:hypothetical protein